MISLAAHTLSAQTSPDNMGVIEIDAYFQRHTISVETPGQILTFNNLIVGETYHFVIPDDPGLAGCRPKVSMLSPDATLMEEPSDLFGVKFVAVSASLSVMLSYPCSWSADNPLAHPISIACMTCRKSKLKDYISSMDVAVLEVGGASAEELVRDVLIGGDCFDIAGLTFSGFGDQIGTFSNGQTNIGIATGVIMATGGIGVAPGPNNAPNASAGYGASTPDADLQLLSGSGAIFDKAEISFSFTPTQSPVLFEYVFASEEYCEYVNSQFNDAFGFFLSGPGINGPFSGAENIAQVGGAYVAINSINHLVNAGLYVNNQPADQNLCGQNPAMGVAVNEVQYDGFTRRLTAIAAVQPCQTYNIKLKVADVGDGIFDSAVFLRAGSFSAGGNVSVQFQVNGEPANEVFEACGQVQLIFTRVGGGTQSIPVQFTIGGTATPGVDYTPIPPIVVIPSGQQQAIVNITIFNDMILEGEESIIITLANPCSCLNPEEILIIKDRPQLDAIADTVSICGPSGIATVGVAVLDGVEPFTFQWSNGSTSQEITPFVPTSTNFRVTVTDGCGSTVVRTARIIVNPVPIAQLFPPGPQLCPGGSAQIPMNFIGQGPFILNYTINGVQQFPVDVPGNPFSLTVNQPGLYQIIGLEDSLGCPGTGQGVVTVTMSNLAFNGTVNNVSCFGQNNGSITTTTTGGIAPYQYVWSGPVNIPNNTQNPNNLPAGTYNVTMTDSNNCSLVRTFTITAPQALSTSVDSIAGVNCASPNGGGIFINVGGGTPGYTYQWSHGANVQNPQNLPQGNYQVTVTDANGCASTNTASVPGDFNAPDAVASVSGSLSCVVNSLQLSGAGSS
ncbi:MAG: choice-of-anchor L domain-containing protein, partial [Saprospiraceae bacterium]